MIIKQRNKKAADAGTSAVGYLNSSDGIYTLIIAKHIGGVHNANNQG